MTSGYKLSKIYVGANQVRPSYRTFTISWEEKADMSSGWIYSDNATGLTAGSSAFDEFFGYSGVRLSSAGVETAEITQTQSGGAGKLDITQLGTITSGDNVMIKFPVRGIKMSKSGSVVTLSITDGLDRENEGYQYYAHCTGTLSNPGTPEDAFYLGAYISNSSGKSLSGQTPYGARYQYQSSFINTARGIGTGYNIMGFYQRMYINALYMMKYGNPDSQSVVGKGYVSGAAVKTTGATNSQVNATYGDTGNLTTQIKLFGLEDWWGNMAEHVGGVYNGSGQLYIQLSGYRGTYAGGEASGVSVSGSANEMTSILGNNIGMFMLNGTTSNTSYNTYYCDFAAFDTSNRFFHVGGNYADGAAGGIFTTRPIGNTQYSVASGARLLYMPSLT